MTDPTTGEISDEQIEQLFTELPPGHYAVQWTLDARFQSVSHPHRQSNARRECARLWNARHKEVSR